MNGQSVHDRLKNLRRTTGKNLQELMVLYSMERFLYRLSVSDYKDKFVLKGGALLYSMLENKARMTRDMDFLANHISNSHESIAAFVQDIAAISLDDAVTFDVDSLDVSDIAEDAEYHGVRCSLLAHIGQAEIPTKIDIGFSDDVYPEPALMEFPSLLGMEPPRLLGYPIEAVIAEKYEAMISLGMMNSRFKDFYDIVFLSGIYEIKGAKLQQSLFNVLRQRGTNLSRTIYTSNFVDEKQKQWQAFKNRIGSDSDLSFQDIMQRIKKFMLPVHEAIERGKNSRHIGIRLLGSRSRSDCQNISWGDSLWKSNVNSLSPFCLIYRWTLNCWSKAMLPLCRKPVFVPSIMSGSISR